MHAARPMSARADSSGHVLQPKVSEETWTLVEHLASVPFDLKRMASPDIRDGMVIIKVCTASLHCTSAVGFRHTGPRRHVDQAHVHQHPRRRGRAVQGHEGHGAMCCGDGRAC